MLSVVVITCFLSVLDIFWFFFVGVFFSSLWLFVVASPLRVVLVSFTQTGELLPAGTFPFTAQ